jgi:hypothetical protein
VILDVYWLVRHIYFFFPSKVEIVKKSRLYVVKVKSLIHYMQTLNRSNARTTYVKTTIVIGVPIMLVLSAIAVAPSSAIQLVYSQGPPPRQQQDAIDLTFQTTNVSLDGTSYPAKYNITENAAEVLSIVADKESFKLIITIAPTKDGKLTVMIPRNLTDYKVAGGKDGKFVVNINAKEITNYQEISNNQTTRGLEINFGKDDRVIEIVGTQMGQADIAQVEREATEMSSPPNTQNVTDNASQTGTSISNQTGEAAQTFVNKSASVIGNLTGEVGELLK